FPEGSSVQKLPKVEANTEKLASLSTAVSTKLKPKKNPFYCSRSSQPKLPNKTDPKSTNLRPFL
ncbi:hypothetical protein SLEP1_g56481, partial [Rubroshorea leprosula]